MTTDTPTNSATHLPEDPLHGLHLHEGVQARWQGVDSIGAHIGARHSGPGIADSLMGSLAGLSAFGGRFGADAFGLASAISLNASVMAAGGPQVRAMSMAELADIVQIILEDEEVLDADWHGADRAAPRTRARPSTRRAPPGEAARVAAVKRSLTAARRQATKRVAQQRQSAIATERARAAQLAEIGADPAQIASSQQRLLALQSEADQPLGGDSLTAEPGSVGPAVPGTLGLHALAQTLQSDPDFVRRLTGVSTGDAEVIGDIHPQATVGGVGWHHAGSRALRLADATAELAMLQPGVQAAGFADTPGGFSAQTSWTASPVFDAYSEAAATLSTDNVAALRAASRIAGLKAAGKHSGLPPLATLKAAAFGRVESPLARRPEGPAATLAPSLDSMGSARPDPTQALTAATRFTAGQLQARMTAARAIAAKPGAQVGEGPGDAGLAGPTRTVQAALAGSQRVGAAAGSWRALWSEDVLSRLMAVDAGAASGVAAGPQRWLAAGDRILSSDAVREGYQASALGAGDPLTLGADEAGWGEGSPSSPRAKSPLASRAAAAAVSGATVSPISTAPPSTGASAIPTWLAPTSARPAAASARSFDASRLASFAAAGQPAPAARRETAGPVDGSPAVAPSAPLSAAWPIVGSAALAAHALARGVGERLLAGLEPFSTAPAWQASAAARVGMFAAPGSSVGTAGALLGVGGIQDADVMAFDRSAQAGGFARGDVTELRGALAGGQGPGEWLLPGDEGFDAWTEMLAASPTALPPRPATRAVSTASQGGAQALGRGDASASSAPPRGYASASAAAIERFVATHQHATAVGHTGLAAELAAVSGGPASFALAQLSNAAHPVLGVAPVGQADALTPWLVQRALGTVNATQSFKFASAAPIELLELGADDVFGSPAAGPQASARAGTAGSGAATRAQLGATTATQTAAPQRADVGMTIAQLAAPQRARIERLLAHSGMREAALALGGGALDLSAPAGLRAALALFGEQGDGAAPTDLGSGFVARFFGRTSTPKLTRGDDAELTALAPGRAGAAIGAAASAAQKLGIAAATPDAAPGRELVIEGLAGLAALRMLNTGGPQAERELLALGATERPAASATAAGTDGPSEALATAPKAARAPKPGTAVAMHRFSPVGLSRGRRLLGRSRRAGSLLTASRSAQSFRQRVGYGTASLGGGSLLGLGGSAGEEGFHGGDFGHARAASRAERLSEAVRTRRGTRPGHVGHSMGAAEQVRPGQLGQHANRGLPTDFSAAEGATYVDTSPAPTSTSMRFDPRRPAATSMTAAVQRAASAPSAAGGDTHAARAGKAASVARVLSVTASPTANMLPLVAPAARAIATAAAAKPIAESIATSGSNPSMVAPMAGHDIAGQTAGGPGQGSTEKERAEAGGSAAQELDQLAMKIARSVMIRIKRERERRGLHG